MTPLMYMGRVQCLPAEFVAVRSLAASVASTPEGRSLHSELGYMETKEWIIDSEKFRQLPFEAWYIVSIHSTGYKIARAHHYLSVCILMHIHFFVRQNPDEYITLQSIHSNRVYIKVSVECVYICPECVCVWGSRGIITAPVSAGNTIYKIVTVFLQAGGNHGEESRAKITHNTKPQHSVLRVCVCQNISRLNVIHKSKCNS